jgi:hypothetical protein
MCIYTYVRQGRTARAGKGGCGVTHTRTPTYEYTLSHTCVHTHTDTHTHTHTHKCLHTHTHTQTHTHTHTHSRCADSEPRTPKWLNQYQAIRFDWIFVWFFFWQVLLLADFEQQFLREVKDLPLIERPYVFLLCLWCIFSCVNYIKCVCMCVYVCV